MNNRIFGKRKQRPRNVNVIENLFVRVFNYVVYHFTTIIVLLKKKDDIVEK